MSFVIGALLAVLCSATTWFYADNYYGLSDGAIGVSLIEHALLLWLPPVVISSLCCFNSPSEISRAHRVGYGIGIGLISVLLGGYAYLFTEIPVSREPELLSFGIALAVYGQSAAVIGLIAVCVTHFVRRNGIRGA